MCGGGCIAVGVHWRLGQWNFTKRELIAGAGGRGYSGIQGYQLRHSQEISLQNQNGNMYSKCSECISVRRAAVS